MDFGARIYDSRLGRWMSTDPLQMKYSSYSPYNYCYNNPLVFSDPDGKSATLSISPEGVVTINIKVTFYGKNANTVLSKTDADIVATNANKLMDEAFQAYLADPNTTPLVIDGITVTKVQFNITADVNEKLTDEDIKKNTDNAQNYYLIGDKNVTTVKNDEEGETQGGNTGVIRRSSLNDQDGGIKPLLTKSMEESMGVNAEGVKKMSSSWLTTGKSFLHELIHGLGLTKKSEGGDDQGHPEDKTPQSGPYGKQYDITTGNHSDINFKRAPSKRTCSQLFKAIKKQADGTYIIGSKTNEPPKP